MGKAVEKKGRFNEDALMCNEMHFDAKEAYKLLRTNVIYTLPDIKCRKIAITSPNRGEGKSTVAINLAYTLSVTKSKVLLIDLDLRLPSIAKKLNKTVEVGIADYLAGSVNESQIINKTEYENWDIVYSGSIPPTPAELIGSEKMKKFISDMENKYEYIIIDLPPTNVVSDALVAKEIIDGFVIVVRENYSDKRSLADCLRQLDFLDSNVLGFCLVDSDGTNSYYNRKYYKKYSKYYYRRGYGYYKHYGYGYNSDYNRDEKIDD